MVHGCDLGWDEGVGGERVRRLRRGVRVHGSVEKIVRISEKAGR